MSDTAPVDWKATLPEDIRGEPSLATVADVPTLAKRFVDAHKLVGTKRIEEPQPNWKPEQWEAHYKALGRPETPDNYTVPKVELPEGVKLDEGRMKKAKETLHRAGLSDKQAAAVLEYYFTDLKGTYEGATATRAAEKLSAENALKAEWGDKFKGNLDIAKSVISHFGGEDFTRYLDESGHGNDPQMIRFLQKVGTKMLEDTAGKGGDSFQVLNSTKAKAEIDRLTGDKEFFKAWMSSAHPGHKQAVEKMVELQRLAAEGN